MIKATLEQWRMFKAVVEHGGFSQASQAVHKSQSSIHHAVQKLEQSLGVELLEVQGRKASLTDAGRLMLRRGSYLLGEAEKVEAIAASLQAGEETHLHIAIDEAFPQQRLYPALERVSDQFPHLHIELQETILDGSNELLEQGKAVVGLSSTPFVNGLNEELCEVQFVPVAHPDHPLHHQQGQLGFEDLKSFRQIVVRDSATKTSKDSGWLGSDQRWTVSHLKSSIELVSKGFGFAWLPQPAIQALITGGELKRLDVPLTLDRTAHYYLNYCDVDSLGPAALCFMGELRLQSMATESTQL